MMKWKLVFATVAVLFWCTMEWVVPAVGNAGCGHVAGRACVRIDGANAFLSNTDQGLTIVNMSDPSNPIEMGCLQTKGRILDMDFSKGFAYVVDDREGLLIIDVRNPERCLEEGRYEVFGGGIQAFKVFGEYALASISGQGLRLYDISWPATPRQIARMDSPAQVQGLVVVDGLAYVANFNGGLHVFDLRQPDNPRELAMIDVPGRPRSLGVSGSVLFMNTSERKMHIFDIQAPTSPRLTATINTGGAPLAVVSGNHAFFASQDKGFLVYDISDPNEIVMVGREDLDGICLAMCIHDTLAFVSVAGRDEVRVINLQQIVQR
ncbi:LVIVD repeat-containing protein [Desulfonatronum parangueonense]